MKEIDTKQKFILQQCDDYVQSANIIVSSNHPMRGIECVSVRIIRMLFDFSEDHALRFARGRQFQKLAHFFLRQKAGRAMCAVRENVKPARVMRVLVAGEPDVALLRDEADDEDK